MLLGTSSQVFQIQKSSPSIFFSGRTNFPLNQQLTNASAQPPKFALHPETNFTRCAVFTRVSASLSAAAARYVMETLVMEEPLWYTICITHYEKD